MKSIKKWWEGELISTYKTSRGDVDLLPPYYKRPWPAKAFDRAGRFWFAHWKWILSFTAGLAVGLVSLFI